MQIAPSQAQVSFTRLAFERTDGKFTAVWEDQTLVLEEPDDPVKPTAWDSPLLIIHKTGTRCQSKALLITDVYASPGVDYVVVDSYSGSLSYVDFVHLRTCKPRWPTMKVLTKGIQVSGDRLTIEPPEGKVFRLSALNPPELLQR